MPKAFCSQSKSLIAAAVAYFKAERNNGGLLLPLTAVRERVSAELGVSLASVSRMSTDIKKGHALVSPKRKHNKKKPVVNIDNFTECAIRNAVYNMYKNKQHITLKSLQAVLCETDIFVGGSTSLWKVLQNIGFRYHKEDPRRVLVELPHIILKRVQFLSDYVRLKNSGNFQFVFIDETWIFQDGTVSRFWQDDDRRSVRKTKVGGIDSVLILVFCSRLTVLHAGNTNGFIDGAELVFPSATNTGDYHGEMNGRNFLQWFEYQLLRHLEEPSAIVMDNASYHSTVLDKPPTVASSKADIQAWLTEHNIVYHADLLKIQLLELVHKNKSEPVYEVDQKSQEYGHIVLRLPPYHCIFNPIELIWGITKNYYTRHVGETGRSIDNSKIVWQKALSTITPETWRNTIHHTEQEIQKWWDREVGIDNDEPSELIIDIGNSESDDECSFSD